MLAERINRRLRAYCLDFRDSKASTLGGDDQAGGRHALNDLLHHSPVDVQDVVVPLPRFCCAVFLQPGQRRLREGNDYSDPGCAACACIWFWHKPFIFRFGFHTGNDLITNRIVMRIVMQVYCRTGIWVGAAAEKSRWRHPCWQNQGACWCICQLTRYRKSPVPVKTFALGNGTCRPAGVSI